jgi:hypothetical protein
LRVASCFSSRVIAIFAASSRWRFWLPLRLKSGGA